MEKNYLVGITRFEQSFFDVTTWYFGESSELKKWLGFGFYNSIFVIEQNNLCVYYDEEECEEFYKILDEKITEEFFNQICDNFVELIEQSKNAKTEKEIFDIVIMCFPALVIFEEISNYPDYANESMLRRLIRVRKHTESFIYELSDKVNISFDLNKYLFFQGKIIKESFEEFIERNNFKIIK